MAKRKFVAVAFTGKRSKILARTNSRAEANRIAAAARRGGRDATVMLGDPNTGCPVRRVYTGPTQVNNVARVVRKVPGTYNVVAGTQHVWFDFPGSVTELRNGGRGARDRAILRSYTRDAWWRECRRK